MLIRFSFVVETVLTEVYKAGILSTTEEITAGTFKICQYVPTSARTITRFYLTHGVYKDLAEILRASTRQIVSFSMGKLWR